MLKIFRAHLRTAGKTVEDIKKIYDGSDGQEPSKEEIQRYINVLNSLEGLEVLVFDRSHLGESDYGLYLWKKEDEERIRELFYEAEQDPYFGSYVNERDDFIKDWETEVYDFGPVPTFDVDDIEIIEEIKSDEEVKEDAVNP